MTFSRRTDHTASLRWPLKPLLDRVHLTAHELSNVRGFTEDSVGRAKEDGLTDRMADKWATRLRLHPSQVWGREWDEAALLPYDDVFVNGDDERLPGWRQAYLHDEAIAAGAAPMANRTRTKAQRAYRARCEAEGRVA